MPHHGTLFFRGDKSSRCNHTVSDQAEVRKPGAGDGRKKALTAGSGAKEIISRQVVQAAGKREGRASPGRHHRLQGRKSADGQTVVMPSSFNSDDFVAKTPVRGIREDAVSAEASSVDEVLAGRLRRRHCEGSRRSQARSAKARRRRPVRQGCRSARRNLCPQEAPLRCRRRYRGQIATDGAGAAGLTRPLCRSPRALSG